MLDIKLGPSNKINWTHDEINRNLNKKNINKKINGETILLHAIKINDIKLAKEAISFGADISLPDDSGRTPLWFCTIYDNETILKELLNINVDLEEREGTNTPLYNAIKHDSNKVAKLLIKNSKNLNILNKDKHTAIYCAVFRNNLEIVKELLNKNCKLDENEDSPYNIWELANIASNNHNLEMYKMLITSFYSKDDYITFSELSDGTFFSWVYEKGNVFKKIIDNKNYEQFYKEVEKIIKSKKEFDFRNLNDFIGEYTDGLDKLNKIAWYFIPVSEYKFEALNLWRLDKNNEELKELMIKLFIFDCENLFSFIKNALSYFENTQKKILLTEDDKEYINNKIKYFTQLHNKIYFGENRGYCENSIDQPFIEYCRIYFEKNDSRMIDKYFKYVESIEEVIGINIEWFRHFDSNGCEYTNSFTRKPEPGSQYMWREYKNGVSKYFKRDSIFIAFKSMLSIEESETEHYYLNKYDKETNESKIDEEKKEILEEHEQKTNSCIYISIIIFLIFIILFLLIIK